MKLRFYSGGMVFLGEMENMRSLIWTRKYVGPGDFSLVAPITPENIRLCRRGNIVWKRGAKEAGIIESIVMTEDSDEYCMTVVGRFLSSILDRRIIQGAPFTYSGPLSDAYEKIIAACTPLVSPADNVTFSLARVPADSTILSFEATYRNLLKYVQRLASASGHGFRIVPDFNARSMTLVVYSGIDRSYAQNTRPRVTFSKRFGNLRSATWTEDDIEYKNVGYVLFQKDKDNPTIVPAGDVNAAGLARREVRLDAETEDDKLNVLVADGERQLKTEYPAIASMECETMPDYQFVYGVDYDLGDIVEVRADEWGIRQNLRLTEVSEAYENGCYTINPTFGDPLPIKVKWDDDDN